MTNGEQQGKVRVHLRGKQNIYVHNDLSNAAHFLKKRVEKRLAEDDREGITFDIIAALSILAFATEARFNFLGWKLITNWEERRPALEKVEKVCAHLGVSVDFQQRPFASLKGLKDFRDTLAHGKPTTVLIDGERDVSYEELNAISPLSPPGWELFANADYLYSVYADADELWRTLLSKSGLQLFDTLTHGDTNIQFIEHLS